MQNVGKIDQIIRIILAIILVTLVFILEGENRYFAIMIAGILFFTGIARYCPIYKRLGISSNKKESE